MSFLKKIIQYRRKIKIKQLHDPVPLRSQLGNPYFKSTIQKPSNFKIWLRKDGWALGGIIILILFPAGYYIFATDKFILNKIIIAETQFLKTEEIQKATEQFQNQKKLFFIPQNRYWTLNPAHLQNYIFNAFSSTFALENVQVQKKFPNQLHITIAERIPSLTWVTKDESGAEHFYLIDREGIVTQVIANFDEVNKQLPRVRDDNRSTLGVGWHIISAEYLNFLFIMHEELPKQAGISIDSYIFPQMQCTERQYVAEKIFKQEILASASDEYREKKKQIQEQFRQGKLTIDQSLDELEMVKNEELAALGAETQNTNKNKSEATTKWAAIDVPVECDYVKVAKDLQIMVAAKDGDYTIYADTTIDINKQLAHLQQVLKQLALKKQSISYIDLRLPDRVFYKEK